MALKLDERYPGRANPASIDYPQGSFKNRTSPDSKDGTYLEQDWANDTQGLLQSLISESSITPNGLVDKVGSSQYFDALKFVIKNEGPKQSTESLLGTAKIATQPQVNAGVEDLSFVTPKKLRAGFASSFGQSGYIAMPTWLGGWIIQWVTSGSVGAGSAVTTPWLTAFPVECMCAIATPVGIGVNTTPSGVGLAVSVAGNTVYNWGASVAYSGVRVFAIGR